MINPTTLLQEDPELKALVEQSWRTKQKHLTWLIEGRDETFEEVGYYEASEDSKRLFEAAHDITKQGVLMKQKEKDIKRLGWLLRSTDGTTTKWEEAYNYAMEVVRIEDVIRMYLGDVNLSRNIACPLHEDNSPSLHIYPNTNSFHCFGCHANGKPVNFVMLRDSCTFKEAVYKLSNF